jgi:hypothetical protein
VHLLARPRARLVNPRSKQRKVAVAFVLLCETSHRSACVARRSAAALPALAKCYRQQGLNHLPTGPAACMHAISVCTYDAVAYGIASRKRTTRERCCSVASHILAWFDLGQTNKQRPHICSAALAGTLRACLGPVWCGWLWLAVAGCGCCAEKLLSGRSCFSEWKSLANQLAVWL